MGNSHDPSLGRFGVTAAAQRLLLFYFAVIWCPHISGQCIACRIIFLLTLRKKWLWKIFSFRSQTHVSC